MIFCSISAAANSRSSSSRSSSAAAGLRVDLVDLVALLQEDAVHPHVRLDTHDVVVDEVALADRPLVLVAVDEVLEVGHGVRSRRGGQADLDGVEVFERVAPDRQLLGRVAAVALVGDDQVEGVDRDVELLGVLVDRPRRPELSTDALPNRLMLIRWMVQT